MQPRNLARLLLLAVACSLSFSGTAAGRDGPVFIGIPDKEFAKHYRVQRQQNWCWASCAEMVLAHSGVRLPQEAIVSGIKGMPIDRAGSPAEMIRTTNVVIKDASGGSVVLSGQYVPGAPLALVLYNHVKQGRPVILNYTQGGYTGHAVIVTGVDADVAKARKTGMLMVSGVHVWDPFAYRSQRNQFGAVVGFVPDPSLRRKRYGLRLHQGRLHLTHRVNGQSVAVITGVILVEATKL